MLHDKEFYMKCLEMEHDKAMDLARRLIAIKAEAKAELDRIEKHGGCAGFAARVWRLAGGGGDD